MMIGLGLLLIAAQPLSAVPVDPATMNPAQRRAADAIGAWMNCVAPLVADRSFGSDAAADEAADGALATCRSEDRNLRAAFEAGLPARQARALYENIRGQFRQQVRAGTIRRSGNEAR